MDEGIETSAQNQRELKGQSPHRPREWERAHAELVRLSQERARLDADEGHWLLIALRTRAHARLGYASFVEYVERLFGYSPRWTAEKLRVAEALATLPSLSRAVASGEIPWSHARELTRVATPATEDEWLASAQGRTARDIERLVSGRRPGSRPGDRPDPSAIRHVLRFDVSSITFAAFREALGKLRRDAEGPLADDEALLLMARRALGASTDAGESSYQLALTICERCRHATADGCGEPVSLERDVIDMAACDATSFAITPTEIPCTGELNETPPAAARARQSVPPSIRRLVHHRDHGCCRVPGCRHAVYVDVHHLDPKSEGGANDPENLILLCSAHHRAVHSGRLVIRGRASSELAVSHSDGSKYGSRRASPHSSDTNAVAFRALRALGFRETETRRALDRAGTHVGHSASLETLVRQALGELTPAQPPRRDIFGPKAA